MAKIATCPTCAKQLGLPDSIALTDRVECPECHVIFSLSETVQISLPVAQVLAPIPTEPTPASAPVSAPAPTPTAKREAALPTLASLTPDSQRQSLNAQPTAASSLTSSSTSSPSLQNSWEERLRNVLAKGDLAEESPRKQEPAAFSAKENLPTKQSSVVKQSADVRPLTNFDGELKSDAQMIAKTVSLGLEPTLTKSPVKPAAKQQPAVEQITVKPQAKPETKSQLLDRTLQAAMPQMAMVAQGSQPKAAEQKQPPEPKFVEPVGNQKIAPGKTLAELSATTTGVSLGLGRKAAQATTNLGKATTSAAMTVTKKTAAKTVAVVKAATKKTARMTVDTLVEVAPNSAPTIDPHRRLARRGFPKVAAFAVGPIAGCLLGLYGLLWLQGARADHIGLGKVLPVAMLPANVNEKYCTETLLVESSSEVDALEPTTEIKSTLNVGVKFKTDSSLMPASAEMPLHSVSPEVQIRIDEFNARVDAAAAALPNLAAGDLSTRESIRTKGQAYMTLCQLAEQLGFAQQPGLPLVLQAQARRAEGIFQQAAEQASLREELAHIAGEWWAYADRSSPGVFLTGQIQHVESTRDGTLCWVKISTEPSAAAIPVWFQQARPQAGDRLGIVGTVAADSLLTIGIVGLPANFAGRQLVVATYHFPLPVAQ